MSITQSEMIAKERDVHTYRRANWTPVWKEVANSSVLTFHDGGGSLCISPYLYLAAYLTRSTKR